MDKTVSAIIITFNAGKDIGDCLSSVSWCDEIIVVDSGSTDNTVGIARGHTDKVFVEDWKGYGPQKKSAVDKASCEWVLSADADEIRPVIELICSSTEDAK